MPQNKTCLSEVVTCLVSLGLTKMSSSYAVYKGTFCAPPGATVKSFTGTSSVDSEEVLGFTKTSTETGRLFWIYKEIKIMKKVLISVYSLPTFLQDELTKSIDSRIGFL